ncbi:hypothetical protein KJB62_10835 [Staphylococcus saprophyticus]|uniref:hypothetical protein n=1 Tax=Staphylococcus saprophyticus TaxID=29385 RepID=UPI001F1D090F|nr:hypothetical protein [Staphylococcus saprophyticus]MCE5131886.1 hypothetical protein [Staphylococcus saprophyticus]
MARTTNKNITDIEKKVVTPIEKINFDNIDFGDIEMDESNNKLVLSDETSYNNIINEMQNFINELTKAKNDYTQNKINEIIIEKLQKGGNEADVVKQLFNNNNTNSNSENGNNDVETDLKNKNNESLKDN